MSDKVVGLRGAATSQREVCEGCVGTLQDALEKAQSGEAVGAYIVIRYHDGTASWQGGGKVGGFTMLGAMATAHEDLMDINRGQPSEDWE